MPIATPAAPYASAATSPRPSWKPPAATTGMSTASTTCGSSTVVATSPVCPPPSPPCTITASAPHAATFSACRRAPTDGIDDHARVLELGDQLRGRGERERRHPHALLDDDPHPLAARPPRRPAGSPRRARRPYGTSPPVRRPGAASGVIVAEARMPSAPAFAVAETRRGPATQPMPVCTIGWRTPTSRVSAVSISASPHLPRARALRVDHLADQPQLGRRSVHACTAPRPGRRARSPVASSTCATRDPRVQRGQPHRVVRGREVEDPQVGHDPRDVVEAGGGPSSATRS